MRTVPGAGRKEFEDNADHFANVWGAQRVSVSQPAPGRLIIRGMRSDPLLQPLSIADAPAGRGARQLWLGRDESGDHRFADLASCPGIVVGGMPGAGKSTQLTSWLTQWAPLGNVQFVTLDGKNAGEFDDFDPRAWMTQGNDLDNALAMLEEIHDLMTARLATVRKVLGVKNGWHVGPSVDWPLVVLIIDECQEFLDLSAVKGDKDREPKVRRCIALVTSLIKQGRSAMHLTIVATQRPTVDSIPGAIRDNCPVALAFGLRAAEGAVAALGSSIREFPSYSPLTLADRAYAGCFTATLDDGRRAVHPAAGPVGERRRGRPGRYRARGAAPSPGPSSAHP